MAVRERVAGLLLRVGAIDGVLWGRAKARSPLVSVLTHHHVLDPPAGYPFDREVADATPAQFRRRVELVARRYSVIGIDDLCRALDGGPLPPNPALLTFDDGYRSCVDVAAPILRQVGVRGVFFVSTTYVNERRLYWWERIAYVAGRARNPRIQLAYPERREVDLRAPDGAESLLRAVKDTAGLDLDRFLTELTRAARVDWDADVERRLADELIMDWSQVRALRDAGMDVESHTRSHRVLQTLDARALADELAGSRADLERELGRRVRAIAYPTGRPIGSAGRLVQAVAAAGYEVGFTNVGGSRPITGSVARYDFGRIATDRAMSDAMLLAQMAIPCLAYPPRHVPAAPAER